MFIFPSPYFLFVYLINVVSYIVIGVTEKRAANIRRMMVGSPMLAIRRKPADHDTQACWPYPTRGQILIQHFYHRWYIVVIPEAGVVYYQRT